MYTIGFCVYQRNYLIINKAVISFRYAVFKFTNYSGG